MPEIGARDLLVVVVVVPGVVALPRSVMQPFQVLRAFLIQVSGVGRPAGRTVCVQTLLLPLPVQEQFGVLPQVQLHCRLQIVFCVSRSLAVVAAVVVDRGLARVLGRVVDARADVARL